MDFILKNYLVIIFVGLFFVFALIGYLIDMLRKKENEKEDIPVNIKPVELKDLNIKKQENEKKIEVQKENNNDADDLLKNYNENITE